ncbi:MAG: glycosyltransferase family 39 protein [Desulfatitalea sp.]|nr:glycosyltransferase family 39 protein [Desulfatitalea sp.]NNK00184.1 glycosyltransferase family 39 protein [Desulfatitalea sp.]
MPEPHDHRLLRRTWILIGICTLGRLLYAQAFFLVPDETNYWQWSRHLDWGYHDQAPMIAWTIHLATRLLGHSEWTVRLPSVFALTVASIYLVLMARRWFSAQVAWQTALVSQAILLFNIGSLLATADGLQAMAWAGACYHAARAYEDNTWGQWFAGGAWFGFGLLSKYTVVLFLPCLLAYALFSKKHRGRMISPKPYLACLLGLLMFSPVIYWNASHQWNSMRHVAYIGGANDRLTLHLNFFGDYLASQAALLTPMLFILIVLSWLRFLQGRYPKENWFCSYLFFTSLPVFAGFAVLSLHTRVYGNWPGFGYVSAVLLSTVFWSGTAPSSVDRGGGSKTSGTLWRWSVVSAYVFTGIVLVQVIFPVLPIPARFDRSATESAGWDLLGKHVDTIRRDMPNAQETFLFGFRYQIASELAFYVPGQPRTVSINRWSRPNVYDYWWQDADLVGMDAVGVLESAQERSRLLQVFEHVSSPEKYDVFRRHIWHSPDTSVPPVRTHYIYRCFGFKGGLRWTPPSADDIRATPP